MVHLTRNMPCIVAAVLLAAILLPGCVKNPYTGRSQFIIMSESEEMRLGLEYTRQLLEELEIETGTRRALRVERVGRRIAAVAERPNFDWQFHTVVSEQVNAFVLPGGRVFFYTGILELIGDNEDELAAIMGHEIAHAVARHAAERMSQNMVSSTVLNVASQVVGGVTGSSFASQAVQTGGGLVARLGVLLPYSRRHELEADHIGVILAAKAGYDPRAALSFWDKMAAQSKGREPLGILSTHPLTAERKENLHRIMPEALRHYRPRTP